MRAVLRDVFGWKHVDAGGGWLIFALPPAEIGVHPAEGPNFESGARHQLSFMCDDIEATVAELHARGVTFTRGVEDHGYGFVTFFKVPGGFEVQLYQPKYGKG